MSLIKKHPESRTEVSVAWRGQSASQAIADWPIPSIHAIHHNPQLHAVYACLPEHCLNTVQSEDTHRCLEEPSHQQTVIADRTAPGAANFQPEFLMPPCVRPYMRSRASPMCVSPIACVCEESYTDERLHRWVRRWVWIENSLSRFAICRVRRSSIIGRMQS